MNNQKHGLFQELNTIILILLLLHQRSECGSQNGLVRHPNVSAACLCCHACSFLWVQFAHRIRSLDRMLRAVILMSHDVMFTLQHALSLAAVDCISVKRWGLWHLPNALACMGARGEVATFWIGRFS